MQPLQAYGSSLGGGASDVSIGGSQASSSRLHHQAAAQAFESQLPLPPQETEHEGRRREDRHLEVTQHARKQELEQENDEKQGGADAEGQAAGGPAAGVMGPAQSSLTYDDVYTDHRRVDEDHHANNSVVPGSSDSASTDPQESMSMGLFSSRRIAKVLKDAPNDHQSRSEQQPMWKQGSNQENDDYTPATLQSTGYDLHVHPTPDQEETSSRRRSSGRSFKSQVDEEQQQASYHAAHQPGSPPGGEASLEGESEPPVVPDESQLPPTFIAPRIKEFGRARGLYQHHDSNGFQGAVVPSSSIEVPHPAPVNDAANGESLDSFVNQADLRANERLLARRATAQIDVGPPPPMDRSPGSRRSKAQHEEQQKQQQEQQERHARIVEKAHAHDAEMLATAGGEPEALGSGGDASEVEHEPEIGHADLEPTLQLPTSEDLIQQEEPQRNDAVRDDAPVEVEAARPPLITPTGSQKSEAIRSIPEHRKLKRVMQNGERSGADNLATEIINALGGPANAQDPQLSVEHDANPEPAHEVASLIIPRPMPVVKMTYKSSPKKKRPASPVENEEIDQTDEARPSRARTKRTRTSDATTTDSSRPSRTTRRRSSSRQAATNIQQRSPSPATPPSASDLRVFARYANAFYPARVVREVVAGSGLYDIRFDDGTDGTSRTSAMRRLKLKRGDAVAAVINGKKGVFMLSQDMDAIKTSDTVEAIKCKTNEVFHLSLTTMSVPKVKQVDGRVVHDERLRRALALSLDPSTPCDATSDSASEDETRDATFAGKVFILSGISAAMATDEDQVKQVKNLIARKSGAFEDDVWKVYDKPGSLDAEATFKLSRKYEQVYLLSFDQGVFNAKWMMALALGIPCLSPRFVLDSAEGEVDVRSYLLSSGHSIHLNGPASQVVGFHGANNAHRRPFVGKTMLCIKADDMNVSNTPDLTIHR